MNNKINSGSSCISVSWRVAYAKSMIQHKDDELQYEFDNQVSKPDLIFRGSPVKISTLMCCNNFFMSKATHNKNPNFGFIENTRQHELCQYLNDIYDIPFAVYPSPSYTLYHFELQSLSERVKSNPTK